MFSNRTETKTTSHWPMSLPAGHWSQKPSVICGEAEGGASAAATGTDR